jgi:hypothetical protein
MERGREGEKRVRAEIMGKRKRECEEEKRRGGS